MKRHAFTLVELLISIAVIGILSGLVLGAYQKANTRAKIIKTQSTIAKLHQHVMTKWESYKFRRLSIDPKQILTSGTTQQANALAYINALWVNRGSKPADPLSAGFPGSSIPTSQFPTTAQLAAVKLLAVRELQRYEMPTGWSEIIETDQAGNWQIDNSVAPPVWKVRQPQVLLTVPQLALAYLQRINAAQTPSAAAQQQLQTFDAAETLYFIVKLASEDESNLLLDDVKQVGDADGDGLPEFQDAFAGIESQFQATTPNNNPIFWNRWPAGFCNTNRPRPTSGSAPFEDSLHVSDFQDDPLYLVEESSGATIQGLQVFADAATFSNDNHDYFDPLRLDIPGTSGTPRGYQLTPVIFSAGPDSLWGTSADGFGKLQAVAWNDPNLTLAQQAARINDPYAIDSHGYRNAPCLDMTTLQLLTGFSDNITSHALTAR